VAVLALFAISRLITLAGAWLATKLVGGTLITQLATWDGDFYVGIAEHGYPTDPAAMGPLHIAHQNEIAFFPLYPMLVRAADFVLPGGQTSAGLAVAWLCGAAATALIWLLARRVADEPMATRAAMLFCFFPGSVVLSLAYSEALMIALSAACLLCLLDRRWLLAGLLAALATATRSSAVALLLPAAWAAAVAIKRDREWRALVAPALAPLGAVSFLTYLRIHTGSWGAWFEVEQKGWGEHVDFGRQSLINLAHFAHHPLRDPRLSLVGMGTIFTVAALVVMWRRGLPATLVLYTLSVLGLCLASKTLGLRPRFVLTAFPLFIPLAGALRGTTWQATLALCAAGLGLLATLYTLRYMLIYP